MRLFLLLPQSYSASMYLSSLGISLFLILTTIFILLSFVLIRLIKNIASQIISGSNTLVDSFGLYVPELDTDFFDYYVYVSLNGVIGGVLLGFAFWTIAKAMRVNKSVAKYLQLCSYGFVLNFIDWCRYTSCILISSIWIC